LRNVNLPTNLLEQKSNSPNTWPGLQAEWKGSYENEEAANQRTNPSNELAGEKAIFTIIRE
jgi:hypothetical protein